MSKPLHHIADASNRLLPSGNSSVLRQQTARKALEMTQSLQTSLDPTRLIEIFSMEAGALIVHQGIRYRNDDLDLLAGPLQTETRGERHVVEHDTHVRIGRRWEWFGRADVFLKETAMDEIEELPGVDLDLYDSRRPGGLHRPQAGDRESRRYEGGDKPPGIGLRGHVSLFSRRAAEPVFGRANSNCAGL